MSLADREDSDALAIRLASLIERAMQVAWAKMLAERYVTSYLNNHFGPTLSVQVELESHKMSTVPWQPLYDYPDTAFYTTIGWEKVKAERMVRARRVLARFYWGLQNGTIHNAMPTPGKTRDMAAVAARVAKIDREWDVEAGSRGKRHGEPTGPHFAALLAPMQQAALVEQLDAALAWEPSKRQQQVWDEESSWGHEIHATY